MLVYYKRPAILVPARIAKARPYNPFRNARAKAFNTLAPDAAKVFSKAVDLTADEITLSDLSDAIENNNLVDAMAAVPWEDVGAPYLQANLPPILRTALEDGGAVGARVLAGDLGVDGISFDITAQAATDWIREHSGDLIQDVTQSQKDTLRAIMAKSWNDELSPNIVARQIRDSELFGLTQRDATYVMRREARLIDAGATVSRARDIVEKDAQRLLSTRADNIGRTEIADSYQEGKSIAWDQAESKGYFDGDEAEQEWVVYDPQNCDCVDLDGTVIGYDEDFPYGDPPIHTNCECDILLHPLGKGD